MTKDDLLKAVSRNVVVFDFENDKGLLSYRLLHLMKIEQDEIIKFYVNKEYRKDITEVLSLMEYAFGSFVEYINEPIDEWYKAEGCTYPTGKSRIVVAESKNGEFLLGAF